jgi:DNA-binding HxlR family transcriptional regulator
MGTPGIVSSSRATPSIRATACPRATLKTPVELTLDTLAGRFRPLIIWNLFWGARPFSELMRHTCGITKRTLRTELSEMERLGLVRRELRLGHSRQAEYSLTPLGQTLRPLIGAMYEWGLNCLKPPDRVRNATGGIGPRPIGRGLEETRSLDR